MEGGTRGGEGWSDQSEGETRGRKGPEGGMRRREGREKEKDGI